MVKSVDFSRTVRITQRDYFVLISLIKVQDQRVWPPIVVLHCRSHSLLGVLVLIREGSDLRSVDRGRTTYFSLLRVDHSLALVFDRFFHGCRRELRLVHLRNRGRGSAEVPWHLHVLLIHAPRLLTAVHLWGLRWQTHASSAVHRLSRGLRWVLPWGPTWHAIHALRHHTETKIRHALGLLHHALRLSVGTKASHHLLSIVIHGRWWHTGHGSPVHSSEVAGLLVRAQLVRSLRTLVAHLGLASHLTVLGLLLILVRSAHSHSWS